MPLYFFHLKDGTDTLLDDEGAEFDSIETAQAAALKEARSIIGYDAMKGLIDLAQRIDIFDSGGQLVGSVEFGDAVDVRGRN